MQRTEGIEPWQIDAKLAAMTVDDVNAALRKYLQTENFHSVLVTKNAADVQAYLEDVLGLIGTTPASAITKLTPWGWAAERSPVAVA